MASPILGYVSVQPSAGAGELRDWVHRIEAYASAQGYALATVFTDVRGGGDTGFYALMAALRHEEAVAVVVPDMSHLAQVGSLAGADLRAVRRYLRARVLLMDGMDGGNARDPAQAPHAEVPRPTEPASGPVGVGPVGVGPGEVGPGGVEPGDVERVEIGRTDLSDAGFPGFQDAPAQTWVQYR